MRAKGTLKADLALATETDESHLEEIALQSLHAQKVTPFEEYSKLVDGVTSADVKKVSDSGIKVQTGMCLFFAFRLFKEEN